MTFWTVMWITILSGELDGVMYPIIYKTEADCNSARSIVGDTLDYDYKMDCYVSELPSGSIRPKARPW